MKSVLRPLSAVLAAAAFAAAADPATNAPAPAAGADAMMGAKAAIAAALRPAPKPAPAPVETNAWDRFQLAVRELERTQRARNGAVPAADWLAAVDLALAVPPGAKANLPTADRAQYGGFDEAGAAPALGALLSVFPATPDWDAVREGLRKRAEANPAPPAGPLLLPALRTAAEFLGGGARGVPEEAFAPLAAAAVPDGVATGIVEKARAALRRSMERPGERAPVPFSPERFARRVERALLVHREIVLPKELAELPDETALPLLRRILAVEPDGNWYQSVVSYGSATGAVARLAALAIAEPAAAGGLAWCLVERAPDGRALFDALSSARSPMDAIRARIDAARAAAEREDDPADPDEDDDDVRIDPDDPFTWNDRESESGFYAQALADLISKALDDGRPDDAEALAAAVRPGDWNAFLSLTRGFNVPLWRPGEAFRDFIERRLPSGEALLDSRFLDPYAKACLGGAADRFEATVARLLGPDADGDRAKKRLADIRFKFARERGDMDALEPWFRAALDPAVAAELGIGNTHNRARDRFLLLDALGDTNRSAALLDPLLAAAQDGKNPQANQLAALAVGRLADAGRFADAERLLVESGLAAGRGDWEWRPDELLVDLYQRAGRPADAIAFALGWPRWSSATVKPGAGTLGRALVRALAVAGDAEQKAYAVAAARGCRTDWAHDALFAAASPAEIRRILDQRLRRDPYDTDAWRWSAKLFRREGDTAAAEEAARRALAVSNDPMDGGHLFADDRTVALESLAAVLESKGGEPAAAEAAALRRSAKALRLAARLLILRSMGFSADARRLAAEAADLDPGNGFVRLAIAKDLWTWESAGESVPQFEAAFRALPAELCAYPSWYRPGFFPCRESVDAAERILPALAAEPSAGAPVHFLLGDLRGRQDRPDEAFAAYARAVELDPGFLRALDGLLDLNGRVERPAADWARAQVAARRLDPFCMRRSEEARKVVDWAALWRAFDEAAAALPPPRDDPPVKPFRLEATARVREAEAAARAGAEAAAAGDGGAPAQPGAPDGEAGGRSAVRPDSDMPARLLVRGSGGWGLRLVDVVSLLSDGLLVSKHLGDTGPKPSNASPADAWCLSAGAAESSADDADDYFADDW